MRPDYMNTAWFGVLRAQIEASTMTEVARRLKVSRGAISQIFNGTGLYGTGQASTERFGERVLRMIDQLRCPFLSASAGEPRYITGTQCSDYAHRECPTASPLATRHWQACRTCEQRVPAPAGWHEPSRQAIRIRPAGDSGAASSTGVAAPADQPSTEREAA